MLVSVGVPLVSVGVPLVSVGVPLVSVGVPLVSVGVPRKSRSQSELTVCDDSKHPLRAGRGLGGGALDNVAQDILFAVWHGEVLG